MPKTNNTHRATPDTSHSAPRAHKNGNSHAEGFQITSIAGQKAGLLGPSTLRGINDIPTKTNGCE